MKIENANAITVRDTGTGQVFETKDFKQKTTGHFEVVSDVTFYRLGQVYILRFVDVSEVFATHEKTRAILHLKGRDAMAVLGKTMYVMNEKSLIN